MGQAAAKLYPATYADLDAAPPDRVAELIEGTLYTFPRPAPKHGTAASNLCGELALPFGRGRGGPPPQRRTTCSWTRRCASNDHARAARARFPIRCFRPPILKQELRQTLGCPGGCPWCVGSALPS